MRLDQPNSAITYGFIGGGNMASALMGGLLRSGLAKPDQILVGEIDPEKRSRLSETLGVSTTERNQEVVSASDCLILAIKPQNLKKVSDEIGASFPPGKTLISILAGVSIKTLKESFNGHKKVVRVMPNLPATVGQGVSAIAESPSSPEEALSLAEEVLGTVGETVRVAENLMDAVTAVSGSGPGYIFRIADLLIRGGIEVGLSEKQAARLVTQTLLGSAALLASSEESAEELCDRVCSPGGTTLAGLEAMMRNGLENALKEGIRAARDRSLELSGQE